ncbi:DUF6310 domain-containing protein [Hyalangium rubrum]|uniref:DUF6310 domain-containing protein n=1 Tax=Hyalangium rubrum TaxID=3103134 RepID=A0ABU5H3Z5_9BACT|nr:DUF6310 domain-containing protein [Hyalangium sp. s54d21]MDY7227609.1 DUF6310 domain-containing protein [Hyalangium sp. s54d21]
MGHGELGRCGPRASRLACWAGAAELQRERSLAMACGFDFQVGVRSAAHKAALEREAPDLTIVIMTWC